MVNINCDWSRDDKLHLHLQISPSSGGSTGRIGAGWLLVVLIGPYTFIRPKFTVSGGRWSDFGLNAFPELGPAAGAEIPMGSRVGVSLGPDS